MSRHTSPPPALPTFQTSASDNRPFTSPPRTSTLPQQPTQSRDHHHPPPHRTHRTHHATTKSVPQSAIEPSYSRSSAHPLGFGNPQSDVARPHHRTSGGHHHGRHHTHGGGVRDDEEAGLLKSVFENSNPNNITGMDSLSDADRSRRLLIDQANAEAARRDARREIQRKAELVREMREQREEGDEVLRAQLAQLSDVSTSTTRRLDYTYFNLLTSLSHLSAGVRQLHALAVKEGVLKEGFGKSVREVEGEVGRGVGKVSEALSSQAGRAEGLQKRMIRGREKVVGLGGRLDRVRGRVEEAERRDGEGRKRVGRRWTICWVCGAFWVGLLAVILVVRRWRHGGFGVENDAMRLDLRMGDKGREWEWRDERANVLERVPIAETVSSALAGVTAVANTSWTVETAAVKGSKIDAEATLRHLDEL